jgi:hypothetical protein
MAILYAVIPFSAVLLLVVHASAFQRLLGRGSGSD